MRRSERLLITGLLLAAPAAACLWDRDTLAAERAGLPAVYDAVMGLFPQRTREYYQRRIDDLAGRDDLSPELHDDLAVALERVGRYDEAIALMRAKDQRWPGEYTTWANLGTFLAHAGRLDQAAEAVARSLEINPRAHFGREKYQLQAIRYLAAARRDPELLTRHCFLGFNFEQRLGEFFRYDAPYGLTDQQQTLWDNKIYAKLEVSADVWEGVIGMMVIAQSEWPEFYHVLGELLAARGDRRLAWHAYQRAYDLEHPLAYRMPLYQDQVLRALPPEVKRGLTPPAHWALRRQAIAWVKAYQTWERAQLAAGADPNDAEAYAAWLAENPKP